MTRFVVDEVMPAKGYRATGYSVHDTHDRYKAVAFFYVAEYEGWIAASDAAHEYAAKRERWEG